MAAQVCSEDYPPGRGFKYAAEGIRPCLVDTNVPGTYEIRYRVADSADPPNVATATRVVEVRGCAPGLLCDVSFEEMIAVGSDNLEASMNSPPSLVLLGRKVVKVKQVRARGTIDEGRPLRFQFRSLRHRNQETNTANLSGIPIVTLLLVSCTR